MPSGALPTTQSVCGLIGSLVGRNIKAKPGPVIKRLPKGGVVVVYVNEGLEIVAIIMADVAMAAAAGAALAMIPASGTHDAIRNGQLPPNIADNFREVANVMTSLFAASTGRPVRLAEFSAGTLPDRAVAILAMPSQRLDLEIDVHGYGKGALSILVV